MIIKRVLTILAIAIIFLASCKKSSSEIDVSSQWETDYSDNLLQGPSDDQWKPKIFSPQEMALFQSLDTANLSGTVKPGSVLNSSTIYPNPFNIPGGTMIHFMFSSGYNGSMILKYVVVDSHMNSVYKTAIRIEGVDYPTYTGDPSGSNPILLTPNISIGKYRLYYSLSAQSNENFLTSWGNIYRYQ